MSGGIKSNDRVKLLGEVFTPDKIVNNMLDSVDERIIDSDYITATYFEPACGDGQFLVRILYRKLLKVLELPLSQRQLGLVKALSSIYAVDIQESNIKEARERLFKLANGESISTFDLCENNKIININLSIEYTDELREVINTILNWNIIVGDTMQPDKILLKSYHFNSENVSIADVALNYLAFEYNRTKEVNFMSIIQLVSNEDDFDDFDDF